MGRFARGGGCASRAAVALTVPMPTASWVEVSRQESRRPVEDHALVLQAIGITSVVTQADEGYALLVRAEEADRARIELIRYLRENLEGSQAAAEPQRPLTRALGAALVYVAVLLVIDAVQRREAFGVDWWRRGLADAGLIRAGAWWRSVTALGLHADLLHLASNLAFGAFFGVVLAQSVGVGVAWLAFVVTGGIGNWVNAWIQTPPYTSVGASTAVFGMLGVQAAYDWAGRRRLSENPFRRWAPLLIGAALLVWLGGGRQADPGVAPKPFGEFNVTLPRIDVWGHILGFAAGLALGALAGRLLPPRALGERAQGALAAAAIVFVLCAWLLAVR